MAQSSNMLYRAIQSLLICGACGGRNYWCIGTGSRAFLPQTALWALIQDLEFKHLKAFASSEKGSRTLLNRCKLQASFNKFWTLKHSQKVCMFRRSLPAPDGYHNTNKLPLCLFKIRCHMSGEEGWITLRLSESRPLLFQYFYNSRQTRAKPFQAHWQWLAHTGSDHSYWIASEQKCMKRRGHCFSSNCWKCWKISCPHWGFSTLIPTDWMHGFSSCWCM